MRSLLRVFVHSRRYAVIVVATVASTMAVATAVAGSIRAVRHPVSPLRAPEELYVLRSSGDGAEGELKASDRFTAVARTLPSIRAMALASTERRLVGIDAFSRSRMVSRGMPDYLSLTGAVPVLGRFLGASDTVAGAPPSAVISHELWRAVGATRDVLRATVSLDGETYAIVGVAPPRLGELLFADVWVPVRANVEVGDFRRHALVRTTSGRPALERDLRGVAAQLEATHGRGRVPFRFPVAPLVESPLPLGDLHRALIGAALTMLVIACANLANLALARTLARRSRHAVSVALGAQRRQVVRDVLLEGVMLSIVGGAAGTLLVAAISGPLSRAVPPDVPHVGALSVQVDWVVAGAAGVAAMLVAVLFSAIPALVAGATPPGDALRERSDGTARRRGFHPFIVISEVALALALSTCAVLVLRASHRAARASYGHDRTGLVEASMSPSPSVMRDSALWDAATMQAMASWESTPGVRHVTWSGSLRGQTMSVEGASTSGGSRQLYNARVRAVNWNFLSVHGVPIRAGRDLAPGDLRPANPVAVIDEVVASVLWPGEDPVGRQLRVARRANTPQWVRIVGVANQVRTVTSSFDAWNVEPPAIYIATAPTAFSRRLVARMDTSLGPQTMALLDARLRDALPHGSWRELSRLTDEADTLTTAYRFIAALFAGFAVGAIALAIGGVFAVLSYAGVVRRREFAVRLALGSSPGRVRKLMVRDAAVLVLGGTAVGGILSLVASRFVDPFLYDLYRVDALSLVVAELIVVASAALASMSPVAMAGRTDPSNLLRDE